MNTTTARVIAGVILSALTFWSVYLGTAFTFLEWDMREWPPLGRAVAVACSVGVICWAIIPDDE